MLLRGIGVVCEYSVVIVVVDQNPTMFFSEGRVILIEPVTERIGRIECVVREDGSLGNGRRGNLLDGSSSLRSLSGAVLSILLSSTLRKASRGHLTALFHLNVIDDVLFDVVGFSGVEIGVRLSSRVVHDPHQVALVNHIEHTVRPISGDEAFKGHGVCTALAISLGEVLVGQNGEANGTRAILVGEETRIRGQTALDDSEVIGVNVSYLYFSFLWRVVDLTILYQYSS